ncbi:MAG TPA: gephyrin-like molybdotransferase Glp [Vicinamibacterales bacterium]|nr:gephyrin-like molybdotransferase Glp [Vicinamibacterales bacterium]
MRPIRETIAVEEALALVLASAPPIERTEGVALRDANSRVLASPAVATADVPPFDRAAMDGYAVIAEDTFGAGRFDPKTLRLVGTIYTGQVPSRAIARGECVEIATGAPMPAGADAVVMVEETERVAGGDEVRVMTPVYPRQHVGARAADIRSGQPLLAAGDVLTPARIGALAAIGATDVEVFARPRVAIVSTGNEIVPPGQVLQPGQIYDINQFTLASIVAAHGGIAVTRPTVPDTIEALSAALDAAAGEDLLVFSGGSSVGERDLILDLLQRRGEVIFHGVAVKPGKPTAFGRIGGTPFVGMPGYPTSCLSNGYLFLVPLLRRMARLPEYRPQVVRVPLARRVVSTTGRHQFYTVRLQDGQAVPAFKASGDITSMALADGYFEIPVQVDVVEAGEMVDVRLFA